MDVVTPVVTRSNKTALMKKKIAAEEADENMNPLANCSSNVNTFGLWKDIKSGKFLTGKRGRAKILHNETKMKRSKLGALMNALPAVITTPTPTIATDPFNEIVPLPAIHNGEIVSGVIDYVDVTVKATRVKSTRKNSSKVPILEQGSASTGSHICDNHVFSDKQTAMSVNTLTVNESSATRTRKDVDIYNVDMRRTRSGTQHSRLAMAKVNVVDELSAAVAVGSVTLGTANEGNEALKAHSSVLPEPAISLAYPLYSTVWAKMPTFAPWPAMVIPDPGRGISEETGKTENTRVHVLFFDTHHSRGWVSGRCIEMTESFTDQKASDRLIGTKKRKVSPQSLSIAASVQAMTLEERAAFNPFPVYVHEPTSEPSLEREKVPKLAKEKKEKKTKIKKQERKMETVHEKEAKLLKRAKIARQKRQEEMEARQKEMEYQESLMEPIPELGSTKCYGCRQPGDLVACQVSGCYMYHIECVKKMPLSEFKGSDAKFLCPRHMCATCDRHVNAGESIRCTHCHIAYHNDTCVPGGVVLRMDEKRFTCCSHSLKPGPKLIKKNIDFCKVCAEGGKLVCCDTCASSFHTSCISDTIEPPAENDDTLWLCPECDEGKLPLVDDVVFAKLGIYRWWPAKILDRDNLSENLAYKAHSNADVPVYFFGSHDQSWVPVNHMTTYRGDMKYKVKPPPVFQRAVVEANEHITQLDEQKQEKAAMMASKDPVKPYRSIKSNQWLCQKPQVFIEDIHSECQCVDATQLNQRCTDDRCLNRTTNVECRQQECNKDSCQNQRLFKREYANTKVFRTTNGKSWGLAAKEDMKAGRLLIEYVGEVIDTTMVQKRLAHSKEAGAENFYLLGMDNGLYIDAEFKGNHARFINHSCDPNCETQKWRVNGEVRIGVFTIKDVTADTELTFNYQFDTLGSEANKVCKCGSSNCSGVLGKKPKKHLSPVDDNSIDRKTKAKKKNVKRKKRTKAKKTHEDECFTCSASGQLILCDRRTCPKSYHQDCLGLDKVPHGKWDCPWHQCDHCGKRSIRFCVGCPTSTCGPCAFKTTFEDQVDDVKISKSMKNSQLYCLCKLCHTELHSDDFSTQQFIQNAVKSLMEVDDSTEHPTPPSNYEISDSNVSDHLIDTQSESISLAPMLPRRSNHDHPPGCIIIPDCSDDATIVKRPKRKLTRVSQE
eukprot:CFRG0207T1